jgi:transposase-like protein
MYNTFTKIAKDNHIRLNNKAICNAFGCSKEATIKTDINAGTFGIISLSLCLECIKKFQ